MSFPPDQIRCRWCLCVELNHDLPTPLYQQVYDIWKRKIETGELRPGDRIPTERELCEMHGVSQITVRQAIQCWCRKA